MGNFVCARVKGELFESAHDSERGAARARRARAPNLKTRPR